MLDARAVANKKGKVSNSHVTNILVGKGRS